jgi:hypothetical protein
MIWSIEAKERMYITIYPLFSSPRIDNEKIERKDTYRMFINYGEYLNDKDLFQRKSLV